MLYGLENLSQSISLTDLRKLFRDELRLLPSRVLYRGSVSYTHLTLPTT